jgi:hypothetical protein
LVAGPQSRVSLAVRWHGADAAVLWEVEGEPVVLSTSVDATWTSSHPRGETLWRLAGPLGS